MGLQDLSAIAHRRSIEGCPRLLREMGGRASKLKYQIDGVVYKVDDITLQRRLGSYRVRRAGPSRINFPAEEALTTVRSIEFHGGRTGALTPVARLAPVRGRRHGEQRTLHNHGTRCSARMCAGRYRGDPPRRGRDPEVVRALPERRVAGAELVKLPTHCPVCGSPVVRESITSVARCTGGRSCPAQRKEEIKHFASRRALDIQGG